MPIPQLINYKICNFSGIGLYMFSKIHLSKIFIHRLINIKRPLKRSMLMFIDFIIMISSLWLALYLRLSEFYYPPSLQIAAILACAPFIGITVFHNMSIYRQVTRYVDNTFGMRVFFSVSLGVLIWALLILFTGSVEVPRSVIIMYGALTALFIWSSRNIAQWLLKDAPLPHDYKAKPVKAKKVLIYGINQTSTQLLEALKANRNYNALGLIDDENSIIGQRIGGLKVYPKDRLEEFIIKDGVEEIFLSIPEAPWVKKRAIIESLKKYKVTVKALPAISDIAVGKVEVSDLRPIDVLDLLGRETVPPNPELLDKNIKNKVVMVTGAGGSIGSEISRQILKQQPQTLILFDISEAALYEIQTELNDKLKKEEPEAENSAISKSVTTQIIPALGSVLDTDYVFQILSEYKVNTIYHAAAYKHVPLVEQNPFTGLKNNTFGTLSIAKAAEQSGVERFVLVSTDKAVRPTNIMGASKRIAELILQAFSENTNKTVFTIVRFGNVLDSSGSVLKCFRKQIKNGGPVTVTHPNIIRYFMSIPEAAGLVIQAGAMAKGGDVFVLDMGEPIKIDDLARSLISLLGLEVKSNENPNGDISIEYIGLRPGEKLYEELLIGEETAGTDHPRIMKNIEPYLPAIELNKILKKLAQALEEKDLDSINFILEETVEGYHNPDIKLTSSLKTDLHKWSPRLQTIH